MRQVIGIVLLLNAVAVLGAALTGNLPNWPPTQADIHVAEQAGSPLIHLGGEEAPSAGGGPPWPPCAPPGPPGPPGPLANAALKTPCSSVA